MKPCQLWKKLFWLVCFCLIQYAVLYLIEFLPNLKAFFSEVLQKWHGTKKQSFKLYRNGMKLKNKVSNCTEMA
jgi:transposase-like protein